VNGPVVVDRRIDDVHGLSFEPIGDPLERLMAIPLLPPSSPLTLP
jgi:hypothetical protein